MLKMQKLNPRKKNIIHYLQKKIYGNHLCIIIQNSIKLKDSNIKIKKIQISIIIQQSKEMKILKIKQKLNQKKKKKKNKQRQPKYQKWKGKEMMIQINNQIISVVTLMITRIKRNIKSQKTQMITKMMKLD